MISYSEEYINMLLAEHAKEMALGASPYHAFRKMLSKHEEQQALGWDTTCAGCARLLNRLHQLDEA